MEPFQRLSGSAVVTQVRSLSHSVARGFNWACPAPHYVLAGKLCFTDLAIYCLPSRPTALAALNQVLLRSAIPSCIHSGQLPWAL